MNLSFLSFFFNLMLNLLNLFQIFFSSSKVLDVYFFFSIIDSRSTHLNCKLTALRDWFYCFFDSSLFLVTSYYIFCSWLSLTSDNRELTLIERSNDSNISNISYSSSMNKLIQFVELQHLVHLSKRELEMRIVI